VNHRRRSIAIATDNAAFSYQELDLNSVGLLTLRHFFSVGFLGDLFTAFLQQTGALRLRMTKPCLDDQSISFSPPHAGDDPPTAVTKTAPVTFPRVSMKRSVARASGSGNRYGCDAWSGPPDLSCTIERSSHARIISLLAIVSESLAINVKCFRWRSDKASCASDR
jgi:hypothetical protein